MFALREIDSGLDDGSELFGLAKDEADDGALRSIAADVARLRERIEAMEFRRMFANPMDPNPCFVDIQAGSGGTEAQDWAAMLERMYLRYCERRGWQTRDPRGIRRARSPASRARRSR